MCLSKNAELIRHINLQACVSYIEYIGKVDAWLNTTVKQKLMYLVYNLNDNTSLRNVQYTK